jgi:pentatricopeptide repeat protein
MCTAVGSLDLDKSSRNATYNFAVSLICDVEEMDLKAKRVLYPSLVISFAKQRRVFLGRFAHKLYDLMVENEFEMKLGWLIKLLSLSKYNRQDDLPYDDILQRIVDMGGTPNLSVVLPVIHNMFPYTDTTKMRVVLQALIDIEKAKRHGKNENNHNPYKKDFNRIDMSTLEMISTSAARMSDALLILLVWDVLGISGYQPSETIFENTVLAFAADPENGLPQAFVALESMKDYGYKPSRALLRSFSYFIRNKLSTVDDALDIVLQKTAEIDDDNGTAMEGSSLLSLESLNVVMSGYAERGEVEQTLDIIQIMDENDIAPNKDSFSFAIEVLGKDIHRRKLMDDSSRIHRNLEIADSILNRMEKCSIEPSSFIIRQYIELLCLAGEVEIATDVVEKRIVDENDQLSLMVCNKTIYRVALENLSNGSIEKAKEIAEMMSEPNPTLLRKITSKEQRMTHLAKIQMEV